MKSTLIRHRKIEREGERVTGNAFFTWSCMNYDLNGSMVMAVLLIIKLYCSNNVKLTLLVIMLLVISSAVERDKEGIAENLRRQQLISSFLENKNGRNLVMLEKLTHSFKRCQEQWATGYKHSF